MSKKGFIKYKVNLRLGCLVSQALAIQTNKHILRVYSAFRVFYTYRLF